MKRLLVILVAIFISATIFAQNGKLFSSAQIKKIDAVPTMVTGINIAVKTDEVSLKNFIKNSFYKDFGIGKDIEPKIFKAVNIDGTSIFKFALSYKGIPVEGAYTVLTVRNGKIDRINNGLGKIDLDVSKLIAPETAVKSAMKVRNIKKMPKKYYTEKVITKHFGKYVPAYIVRFPAIHLADSRFHVVNAKTGKVIKSGNSTYFNVDADYEIPDDMAAATDMAKIWQFNPTKTPTPLEVELPWVAPYDDADLDEEARGFLTTDKDSEGIRKIKAFNCPNNGEKVSLEEMIGFPITVPMCSPTQLANKLDNGSFIYNDCKDGHEFVEKNMTEEKIDRCAEISMYYHASKIYSYIRGLYKDIDNKGDFYLQNNDAERPLNVIGNFQMPDTSDLQGIMQGTAKLVPMDNAFFSQDNPSIGALLGQFGIKGDLLVFGQGTKGDFAYDGDVVYHEFGHATIYTAGIAGMEFTDKYGLSNEPGAVHEGTADTFSFLMTDDPCTGEYASQAIIDWAADQGGTVAMDKEGDFFCMRTTRNEYTVFEDFIGEVHWDGQPLLAANWAVYQLIKGSDPETQIHRDNMTKLILKTLYAIGSADASFKLWADTFMDEVGKDDNFKAKKADIKKILTDRNFFEEVRARSVNKTVEATYIGAGGAAESEDNPMGGGGGGIPIFEDEKEIKVGPSYLQFYFDVPADSEKNGLKITASVKADSGGSLIGGMGGGGDPVIEVYYKKGAPVEYVTDEEEAKTVVTKDGKVKAKGTSTKSWEIFDAEKGQRYYFQFINTAAAGGIISNIKVVSADVKDPEIIDEDNDSDNETIDEEMSMEDDQLPDEEQTKKENKSSGCSLTF